MDFATGRFSEAAEAALGLFFPVLDKGFVRLVNYMGTDASIVQAARVSYSHGTKTAREDAGLIKYLMRNEHMSPFEQVILTFHMKLPIFVARQMVRHRTARLNEMSARYSVMKDEAYMPLAENVKAQSKKNKQGSEGQLSEQVIAGFIRKHDMNVDCAFADYNTALGAGIAREMARIDLPVSTYTEWYWQCDLRNLLHFFGLRVDEHAQWEIRQYAEVMAYLTGLVAPVALEAYIAEVYETVRINKKQYADLHAGIHLDVKPRVFPRKQFTGLQELPLSADDTEGT